MEDKDLTNINQIDMECSSYDDDDSFGSIKINNNSEEQSFDTDDRNYQRKTNIILDFNDDENSNQIKKISVNLDTNSNNLVIDKNFKSNSAFDTTSDDINAIDMETDYFDEDDEDLLKQNTIRRQVKQSIFDDSDIDIEKELVDNDLFEAKKSKVSTGEVEADYWSKLAKKHAASNKKGAYNIHFHLAGNPKLEMELFNHDMGSTSECKPIKTGGLADNGMDLDGNSVGNAEGGDASVNICGVGGEGGIGESLNEEFSDINSIFDILGFTIEKNADLGFKAIDNCEIEPDIEATDIKDLLMKLSPYINDCFIYPLQINTGENIKTCKDWVDWYTEDKQKEFPKCKNDIKFCAILANYLK